MQAKAIARYIRMSPTKVRRTIRLIKGLPLREAQALLDSEPHRAARVIRKVLDSAAANAENNHGMAREDLWVERAFVDGGPTKYGKRYRFASGGRIGTVMKRMSHVSVVLSDEEEAAGEP